MDFLRFILASIFISFVGLFIYRYENFNRFKMIPHNSSLFVVDRKTKRVTKVDEKGYKVILKGNEPFLKEDLVEAPSFKEMLPSPAEPLSERMPEVLPPEVPNQNIATSESVAYENHQKDPQKGSQRFSQKEAQVPLEQKKDSSVYQQLEDQAIGKAKDMAYQEATSELGKKFNEEKADYEEKRDQQDNENQQ